MLNDEPFTDLFCKPSSVLIGNLSERYVLKAITVVEIKHAVPVDMTRDTETRIIALIVANDLVNTPVGIVDDHDHGRNHVVAIENKDVTVVSIKIGMAFVIFAPRGPGKEEYYS